VSYGRGTRHARDDRGLIRYLLRHRHTTPFEMCEIKVHMKLPIFVARQLIRHRTANVNEHSARYSILDREFYLPDPSVLGTQSASNRQGRGDPVSVQRAARILEMLKRDAETTHAHYEEMLGGRAAIETTTEQRERAGRAEPAAEGIARELARINLPVSFYTQWYWKIDLHNLLHFISLRSDPHAQYEIRVYSEALASLVRSWVPTTYEAFVDYQLEGAHLSRMELAALRALLRGERPDLAALGMSGREQEEFKARFGLT
jgi:thymidylate synthase (FAD)